MANTRHRIRLPLPETSGISLTPPAQNLRGGGGPAQQPATQGSQISEAEADWRPIGSCSVPRWGDLPCLTFSQSLGPAALCCLLSACCQHPCLTRLGGRPGQQGCTASQCWILGVGAAKGVLAQNPTGWDKELESTWPKSPLSFPGHFTVSFLLMHIQTKEDS